MDNSYYHLQWNHHKPNFIAVFKSLLELEELADVTISAEGRRIKAHKLILSACSPYFKTIFATTTSKHPIVILSEIKYIDLKSIIDFMYLGEINVPDDRLADILEVAEHLQVKGLSVKEANRSTAKESCESPSKRRREISTTSKENDNSFINKPINPKTSFEWMGSQEEMQPVVDVEVDPDWIQMSSHLDDSGQDGACKMQEQNFEVTLCANYEGHSVGMNPHIFPHHTTPSASKRGRKPGVGRDTNTFMLALEAVRSGSLGFCKAAKLFGVNNRSLWLEYKKRGYPSKPSNRAKQPELSKTPS